MIPLFKVHHPKGVGRKIENIFQKGSITEGEISDQFEKGGADCCWTDTINGERAMMFSLVKGRSSWINKLGDGPFAVRLVRGTRRKKDSLES